MSIAMDPSLAQLQMIRLDACLSQEVNSTPVILCMVRRFCGYQKYWKLAQVGQFARRRTVSLNDAIKLVL